MLVKTFGAAVSGIDALVITMEVDLSRGIRFFMVGLPDNAVKESQQRIESAFRVWGFDWPGRRIVINMAPADTRKEGSAYDLPLAIGILAGDEQLSAERLSDYMLMGELSLDGSLKAIKGALPIALRAREAGFKGLVLPLENAREAAVVDGLEVYGAGDLGEVVRFLNGEEGLTKTQVDLKAELGKAGLGEPLDFADVRGQESVKRALEVAAAGGHNLIMVGAPGSGKSMLAKRLPSILPPMVLDEALETTKIHSVAGSLAGGSALLTQRPFRSPHHTISNIALVGGGAVPQPGEISLAHNGVLFLDELPEFKRSVLEVLRQPLEDRSIRVSRARYALEYPAGFMLVASMNPCPCGFYNHPDKECVCPPGAVQRYLSRISGPLLDRIDLHVEVVPVAFEKLSGAAPGESSAQIRERVVAARDLQARRFEKEDYIHCNAQMGSRLLRQHAQPDAAGGQLLRAAMQRLGLSARAYDRILKVARTIADLEAAPSVQAVHVAEAIQYRSLDRSGWAG